MIQKLQLYLNDHLDKLVHFLGGYLICTLLYFCLNVYIGFISCLVVGAAKEYLWDASGHGTFDLYDMYCTWAGGLLGLLLIVR